jgi:hypothetical protein
MWLERPRAAHGAGQDSALSGKEKRMRGSLLLLCGAVLAWGQAGQTARPATPFTKQYLKVQPHSAEEDARIVKLYDGVRVCDVMDALDVVGLQDITMMDRNIRPLWRDEQKISHRIHGVALTVRLVPAQVRAPAFASHAAERPWEAEWYQG